MTKTAQRIASRGKNCVVTAKIAIEDFSMYRVPEVLLVPLCNAAAATAYSARAETSGAVTAGADMSQRREVPALKRSAPRRWRRNGGAEMSCSYPPADQRVWGSVVIKLPQPGLRRSPSNDVWTFSTQFPMILDVFECILDAGC